MRLKVGDRGDRIAKEINAVVALVGVGRYVNQMGRNALSARHLAWQHPQQMPPVAGRARISVGNRQSDIIEHGLDQMRLGQGIGDVPDVSFDLFQHRGRQCGWRTGSQRCLKQQNFARKIRENVTVILSR